MGATNEQTNKTKYRVKTKHMIIIVNLILYYPALFSFRYITIIEEKFIKKC